MNVFKQLSTDKLRPTRISRKEPLIVETCESRRLMSSATISGITFQDLSGNGDYADTARLPGVTVDLYKLGSSKLVERVISNSQGSFSFNNLAPGSYTVDQEVPSNFLATDGLNGHSVTLSSGQTAAHQDFEDFQLNAPPKLTDVTYYVTTPGGVTSKIPSPGGNVQPGDSVTVKFKVSTPQTITLVSYEAPNGDFDTTNLQKQTIYSEETATGSGPESLRVTIPDGYFQLDFVAGLAIDHLATNPNVTYHAQDRDLAGDVGGPQTSPVMTPMTSQVSPSTFVAPRTTVVPLISALPATTSLVDPGNVQPRKH